MSSSRHKDEFPPLLNPGLHAMSAADLKKLVVDDFPLSERREALWNNFIAIAEHLKKLQIRCEIWVDGSFLTKKIDPDDVDFVVDIPVAILDTATPGQSDLLKKLSAMAFSSNEKLHSFVMFDAPAIHKGHVKSVELHNQWEKDFGFSYAKKEPKGIAVLKVTP
jgi:hypothetical protein